MRTLRVILWIGWLGLLGLSCRALQPSAVGAETRVPLPSVTSVLTPTPIAALESRWTVRLHPDGPLYVGDLVSLEIIAEGQKELEGKEVQVQVDPPGGATFNPVAFGRWGIGNRLQATLLWAWDTAELTAGEHTLSFQVLPAGPAWTQTVRLLPAEEMPYPDAAWIEAESDCCLVYVIDGTDAARDLDALLELLDAQAQEAMQRFKVDTLDEPMTITFLPRLLGQGGFTGREISVSYLDDTYAPGDIEIIVHHEMIHWLDNRLGGDLRPVFLMEGVAVFLSGGHFKPEDLRMRAAALLPPSSDCQVETAALWAWSAHPQQKACGLGLYQPLPELMDNFYQAQHEISYLEAGAWVQWMVDRWGWQAFSAFYRDLHQQPDGRMSSAVEAGLQEHFQISLAQAEAEFRADLQATSLDPLTLQDLRLTLDTFDTVRHYQARFDPSAYYLTAWLPEPWQMRRREIVADYLRRPTAPENRAIEALLGAASRSLRAGEYDAAERYLRAAQAALAILSP